MKIFDLSQPQQPVEPKKAKKSAKKSEVTALKQQVKNQHRVSIFIDEKYCLSLTLDQLLEHKLKKGMLLSDQRLNELKKDSDEGKLKAKALEWVLLRPHSEREFRDYGFRKKLDSDLLTVWADEFREKKYLNDETFALWFAQNRSRKNKSTRAIAAELAGKGIQREIVDGVLRQLEQGDGEALAALVQKLRDKPRYQDKQKFIRYLASKGFRYEDIQRELADG